MAVPGFQSFLRPVLDQYVDGVGARARHLSDVVASRLQLSAADLEEMIPSGELRFLNRLCWIPFYADRHGLPDRGMNGHVPWAIFDCPRRSLERFH